MVDTALPLSDRLSVVSLERIDPGRNVFRYDRTDPFRRRQSGPGVGTVGRRSRRIVELCPDAAAAKVELETWLLRKRRRGYEAHCDPPIEAEYELRA